MLRDDFRVIGAEPGAHRTAVEFERGGAFNRGRCEKCIRTMVSLEALRPLRRPEGHRE